MEYTKENLVGRNIMDLAWKDDKHPREFTFIFYPKIDLADAMSKLVKVMQVNMAYNPRITFNCTKTMPTIEIKSIFCLRSDDNQILWHFYMEPEILMMIMKVLENDAIDIVWLEDQEFGIRLDKELNIANFWYPDGGG